MILATLSLTELLYHMVVRSLGLFQRLGQIQIVLSGLLGLELVVVQAGLLPSQRGLYLPQQQARGQSSALGQPIAQNSPEPGGQVCCGYAYCPQSCIAHTWSLQSLG